jgi:hypothetical protein
VLNCNEASAIVIEEKDLIDYLLVGSSIQALSALNVPNHQHISRIIRVVLILEAALRGQQS